MTKFVGVCSNCLTRIETNPNSISTGYALYNDKKVCYECCAIIDHNYMIDNGKIDLYLSFRNKKAYIHNWPGTLEFQAISWSRSTTNWGHDRTDVWFKFDDAIWWGRHTGDNDIVRCKKTKRTRL